MNITYHSGEIFSFYKYVADAIKNCENGNCTQQEAINRIEQAMQKDSWQQQADGKEVINGIISISENNGISSVVHLDKQFYCKSHNWVDKCLIDDRQNGAADW